MRSSVRDYFQSWRKLSLITLLVLLCAVAVTLQERISYQKVSMLQKQKNLIGYISQLGRDESNSFKLEESSIQSLGKSKQIHTEYDKLLTLDRYDFLGQYLFNYQKQYQDELQDLHEKLTQFTEAAKSWYDINEHDAKKLSQLNEALRASEFQAIQAINSMIVNNNAYQHERYMALEVTVYSGAFIFLVLFLLNIKRFSTVMKDIDAIYRVEGSKEYTIVTEEIDTIAKRSQRKQPNSENPALIDPLTQINNYKGFAQSYADRKGHKDKNFSAIFMFAVDGFEELNRQYPKAFIQSILKRAASNIHVYEQPTDIIGRTENNEFSFAMFRSSRDHALKDCKDILQSFAEATFRSPEGHQLQLSMSVAFVPKMGSETLDELIRDGRKMLPLAQTKGRSSILERRDLLDAKE